MIKRMTQPLLLITILLCSVSMKIHATNIKPSLEITPDRCISLHKGQVCYQQITIHWQSSTKADYCLFQQEISTPLKCWKTSKSGKIKIDFQSTEPLDFDLRQQDNNTPVATSTVSIHWVYKSTKRQKRGWRLF